MIAINKEEKEIIAAKFPDVHIARTMKQKSKRHHYYCEETKPVMRLLKQLRGETNKQGGAKNGHREEK